MDSSREFYQRNLPHYQPNGYSIFVTFRLYGTLPIEVVNEFKSIKNKKLDQIADYINPKIKFEKYKEFKFEYFKLFDEYIDKCTIGSQYLKNRQIADIVQEGILYRDRKEYDLIASTIMPNHVHIVFLPFVERFDKSLTVDPSVKSSKNNSEQNAVSLYRVTNILQHLKKNTAIKCNKLLNRTGPFWQHESYDHVIRDSEELKRIVNYVLNNPVKAKLTDFPEKWEYNYINYNLIPTL